MNRLLQLFLSVAIVAAFAMSASAIHIWTGSTDNDWGTADNWNPASVPDITAGEEATLPDGSTVVYTPSTDWSNNAVVTLNGNSTWTQAGGGHWARIAGNGGIGRLILNDTASFNGGTASRLVVGIVANAGNGTVEINAGASLDTDGSILQLCYDSGTQGRLNVNGGSVTAGTELWFGNTGVETDQTAIITMNGGSIAGNGTVGVWFWDTDATGNTMYIDFLGTDTSTVTVSDRFGRRNTGSTDNQMTWETAWTEGLIRVHGSNTGSFSNYFTTSGTSAADDEPYTLTYTGIPEPSTFVLAGLLIGFCGLIARRR